MGVRAPVIKQRQARARGLTQRSARVCSGGMEVVTRSRLAAALEAGGEKGEETEAVEWPPPLALTTE